MENRLFCSQALSVLIALGITLSYLPPVAAVEPVQHKVFSTSNLTLLENRFFSHAYAHDPVEKRLERLECLIFGSMKDGSNEQRLQRLSTAVSSRPAGPLPSEKTVPSGAVASGAENRASGGSSAQYPILNTLEWRALKKTFGSDSLDQRLDRMESSLFGQPAQGMAYIDRVDRLKKTLGVGVNTGAEEKITTTGPLPKARPRSGNDLGELGNSFAVPEIGSVPMPPMFPGLSGFDTIFGASFDKRFQQMFEEMNKNMLEARKLGPGNWVFDQKTGSWMDMRTGKQIKPGVDRPGGFGLPQAKPPESPPTGGNFLKDLPLYSDPNSI